MKWPLVVVHLLSRSVREQLFDARHQFSIQVHNFNCMLLSDPDRALAFRNGIRVPTLEVVVAVAGEADRRHKYRDGKQEEEHLPRTAEVAGGRWKSVRRRSLAGVVSPGCLGTVVHVCSQWEPKIWSCQHDASTSHANRPMGA